MYLITFSLRFAERSARWLFFPNDDMVLAERELQVRKRITRVLHRVGNPKSNSSQFIPHDDTVLAGREPQVHEGESLVTAKYDSLFIRLASCFTTPTWCWKSMSCMCAVS